MSEIYRLNKDLYDVNVTDIQRAANEINKKYLGFDGDKKVFEEMIKFDSNPSEISRGFFILEKREINERICSLSSAAARVKPKENY